MKKFLYSITLIALYACTENKPAAEADAEFPAPEEQSIAQPSPQNSAPLHSEVPTADSAEMTQNATTEQDTAANEIFSDTAETDPRVKRILDEKLIKK